MSVSAITRGIPASSQILSLEDQVRRLEDELEIRQRECNALRQALTFYAQSANYEWDVAPDPAGTRIPGTSPVDGDHGERARHVLDTAAGCPPDAVTEDASDPWTALRTAAQAVIRRWHTPLWKRSESTAKFIQDLERAVLHTQADPLAGPVPATPSQGRLMSMAIRYDHALGMPGYYDSIAQCPGEHARRVEGTLTWMRQLYEEATGQGFYRLELESRYVTLYQESQAKTGADDRKDTP